MQQLADAQADLAARSELETLRNDQQTALGELNGRVTNLNEQLESRLQSLAQLENRMADQVSARRELADRVDQLYRRMNSETDDWRIAEAGYLARMAVHRVRFNGDIAGALEALEAADVLLSGLGGVGIDRREAIGRAVDQLLDVERIDQVAINRGLDRVADQLGSLPLAAGIQRFETADTTAGARSDAPSGGWQARLDRAGDRLMTGLSELVTVSRDRQVEPLPEPESRFLLQQNLRLQIESARLAALRGETTTYDNALKRIDDWVSAYFDSSAESVSAVRERLADLMDEPVKVERPAIGETLAPVLNDGGQS
jgi:uroporphyrin-3 C-methyltransferase